MNDMTLKKIGMKSIFYEYPIHKLSYEQVFSVDKFKYEIGE